MIWKIRQWQTSAFLCLFEANIWRPAYQHQQWANCEFILCQSVKSMRELWDNIVKYYICLQKQTVMKRSRLFLWIFGILMQAFLISMHFYQRNMEAMYAETEYLLKEVLNEELHRKQQELNLFYISKVTIDTISFNDSCYNK